MPSASLTQVTSVTFVSRRYVSVRCHGIVLDPRKRAVGGDAEAESFAGVILKADMRKVEVGQPVRGIESEDE